jgi:protein-S-isoprenylcysteine O-methyltransferase Ste14
MSFRLDSPLRRVQTARKAVIIAAILLGVVFLFVGVSRWPTGSLVHETLEWVGVGLIIFCIVGRTWCSLYIGGRKVAELVTDGPYSVTRNPLYLFSILGAAGVGAQLGSLMLTLAAGAVAWLVFYLVVLKEEEFLASKFGTAFAEYRARVPRFMLRLSMWRDVKTLSVQPRVVTMTFVDACIFLVSIPIAEAFEYLHDAGILRAWFELP